MADEDNSWIKDLALLVTAVTGLVVALGFGAHNNRRIDEAEVKHEQTLEKVQQNAEQIQQVERTAEIAKDKAAVVEKKVEALKDR